jgi:peptide/nickel transport system substrate-binding protein
MIFRYNETVGIATLDPAFAKDQSTIWPCKQIYNGLVELNTSEEGDGAMQVEPSIAKSWTISPDGLTYTFTLRDDIYFHKNELFNNNNQLSSHSLSLPLTPSHSPKYDSTRRVVASDFIYSFRRITDPAVLSPGAWVFNEVDTFYATNDTTLVIHLREPFSPFLSLLGMVYCSVVPHEVVEHYGKDFRSHPCGTGPFQLQYWKEGVKLVLRKNPYYFEFDTLEPARPQGAALNSDEINQISEKSNNQTITQLPYLDAVAITFIVDRQTVFLEFVKGNLDFMNSLDASYKDEILTLDGRLKEKYADRIDMVSVPYLNTEYLGFNMEGVIGSEKEVKGSERTNVLLRQAISCGFDRRKMMKYLRNNIGAPGVGGFIPKGLPGYSECGYEYDPDRARRLLAEAGYPNGKGLPTLKLSTTSNYLDLCKYIQQQLGLIGINVEVDVNPSAPLREQMAQGKLQWFRGSWIADYPDAENYLSLFYSPNHAPAGPNYTRFKDAKVDRLYEQARATSDDSLRAVLYHQIDSIVMEQAPVLVLYYDQILHFTHKNVTGLRTNAMNTLDLRRVKIKNI